MTLRMAHPYRRVAKPTHPSCAHLTYKLECDFVIYSGVVWPHFSIRTRLWRWEKCTIRFLIYAASKKNSQIFDYDVWNAEFPLEDVHYFSCYGIKSRQGKRMTVYMCVGFKISVVSLAMKFLWVHQKRSV